MKVWDFGLAGIEGMDVCKGDEDDRLDFGVYIQIHAVGSCWEHACSFPVCPSGTKGTQPERFYLLKHARRGSTDLVGDSYRK